MTRERDRAGSSSQLPEARGSPPAVFHSAREGRSRVRPCHEVTFAALMQGEVAITAERGGEQLCEQRVWIVAAAERELLPHHRLQVGIESEHEALQGRAFPQPGGVTHAVGRPPLEHGTELKA